MKLSAKRFCLRTLAMLLAVLCMFPASSPATHAADAGSKDNTAVVQLTGREANGKYELTTKDLYLFHLEGTVPGDSWAGSVQFRNDTASPMAVAVHSIESTLIQDTALFDVLDLQITVAGEESYNGNYAASHAPVTKYYRVDAGEHLDFDILVTFPSTAGNVYQGKQMDSTWTFDAVFYDSAKGDILPSAPSGPDAFDDPVKTGVDLRCSNTSLIPSLIVFLLSGTALVVTYVRYRSAKKRQQLWQGREEDTITDKKKKDA